MPRKQNKLASESEDMAPVRKIPMDMVIQCWQRHQAQTPDDICCSLRKLYDQQHAMMDYLMKAAGDSFNEAEHEIMYYLGSFIVSVMMQEYPKIPAVPEALMAKARELNKSMLRFLGSEERPQDVPASMDDIINTHNQSDLLRFVLGILMTDPEAQKKVRDENVWYLFAYLKIALDAMGEAIPTLAPISTQ